METTEVPLRIEAGLTCLDVTKRPTPYHSFLSLSPFHSILVELHSIPLGIFFPIFATSIETTIALEVASGDSFVVGTEPDNMPIIWQVWEHEPDTEPDKTFLYYIMWELAVV